MEIITNTDRTSVFAFDEIEDFMTYVYVVYGKRHNFIIDTYCGSQYMKGIISVISRHNNNETIVINTHFHWDHIWGNSAFEGTTIIAHQSCPQLISENWDKMFKLFSVYAPSDLKIVLPNTLFTNAIEYAEDNIKIFYSPGHTDDCISVLDLIQRVLYVGDNMEKPRVFIESDNIEKYINTLEYYYSLNPKSIMAGHTLNMTKEDIIHTISYLKSIK